jgi:hypothetical protein
MSARGDEDYVPPEPEEEPPMPEEEIDLKEESDVKTKTEDNIEPRVSKVNDLLETFKIHNKPKHHRTISAELLKDADILKESAESFKGKQIRIQKIKKRYDN